MSDYVFLFILTLIAIATPYSGKHGYINFLLAGKFAIFIGVYEILKSLGFTEGYYEMVYRASLDLVFAYLFYRIGGFYISFLCSTMVVFHVFKPAIPLDYEITMFAFQLLQLGAACWGFVDGVFDRAWPVSTRAIDNWNNHKADHK